MIRAASAIRPDCLRPRSSAVAAALRGPPHVAREPPQRDFSAGIAPLPVETPLGEEIQKSVRPDCSIAYSGLPLLAVIPLAIDTISGTGCRWGGSRDSLR